MPNLRRAPLFQYRAISRAMAEDLLSSGLFPNLSRRDACRLTALACTPVSLGITDEYVRVVKAWRSALCASKTCDPALVGLLTPFEVLSHGTPHRIVGTGDQIAMINRTFLAFWKAQFPSPRAPWDSFLKRVQRSGKPTLSEEETEAIRRRLSAVLGDAPSLSDLMGRNGPGAVAGGEKGTYKWYFPRRPRQVPTSFFRLNPIHVVDEPRCDPVKYGITRALQVPKDARGPRFISCEPLEYQHCQFAVKDALERRFLRAYGKRVNPYDTSEHVKYLEDQMFCTLDLKDASDMVSRRLVWKLLPPSWARLLFSVRSSFVEAPGGIYPLRTFAPMGSSLCFDVMQMIVCVTLDVLTPAWMHGFHVFGDDVIVPAGAYYFACEVIAKLGLVLNTAKCCGPDSSFRESCGEEWWWKDQRRTSVRPIYFRDIVSGFESAVHALIKAQEYRATGFPALADAVDKACSQWVQRPREYRWNIDLQRLEVKSFAVRERPTYEEELDGYNGLYRWFTGHAQNHMLAMQSPRTRVVSGWFDPTQGNVVTPLFLQLGRVRRVATNISRIGDMSPREVRQLCKLIRLQAVGEIA